MSYREPVPEVTHMPGLLAGLTDAPVPDLHVPALSMDSRQVVRGAVFLACQGRNSHGLDHWPEALARGASAVVWEPGESVVPPSDEVPNVPVAGLSQRVSEIAARYYGHPSRKLFVTGITGTDGKTSCAWILAQAQQALGQPCGYLGTLGYGIPGLLDVATHTTPDPVRLQYWLARLGASGAQGVAMEVSSHALDQGRVNGVAFDVAMLTNLGRDHLDYHGDLSHYAAAKRRLFEHPGLLHAVLNADDETGLAWLGNLPDEVEAVAYGFGEAVAEQDCAYVRGVDVRCLPQGIAMRVQSSWGDAEMQSPLLGRFNAANLLACLSVLLVRGEALSEAVQVLAQATAVPGRMEALPREAHQPLVVVDYAHTEQAIRQALKAAREHGRGKLLCVFGCGGDRDRGKRPLMGQAVCELADQAWVTDDNPRGEDSAAIVAEILAGMPEGHNAQVEHNRDRAILAAISHAGPDDVVLIAGKGHEDYQLVGNERLPFDDRQVAAAILSRAANAGGMH